jgi:hypothetical protein
VLEEKKVDFFPFFSRMRTQNFFAAGVSLAKLCFIYAGGSWLLRNKMGWIF